MIDYNEVLNLSPYSLLKAEKEALLNERLMHLTRHHYNNCSAYRGIVDCLQFDANSAGSYYDIPFLPVRLFKEIDLLSVAREDVFKTMTSSGTTGQSVSKIYLDKITANFQQKTLVKIVTEFTGASRMPMIIIDCPSVVKNREMFSARGAGILGFSIFGSDKIYALDDNMNLDIEALRNFIEKHKGKKILMFGFTFMIWKHFYQELLKLHDGFNQVFDLSNGIMIHGGGWKKLQSESVMPDVFHEKLNKICGLNEIHDYYGMVEQTGCVYMECEHRYLHASIFSDIIIRNPHDFSIMPNNQKGIIQVVSLLPESYPGHSLLTEDEGVIYGEDDCLCGRKGKYFKIAGRLKNAELRGCSDTYATTI